MSDSPKIENYRWRIVALLFFATTINYIDRQVIGLLKPTLELEFNWSEKQYSVIVMAFTAAYALGLVSFGRLIDKIGTKIGYGISIIIWSFSAMAHALAKSTLGFGFARAALGIGEAGNFPAAIKSVTEWFPKKERALATGIFNSGANIGAIIAPVTVYWLQRNYGWGSAFIWTGAIGFIWLVFWLVYYEIPAKQKRVTEKEVEYINSDIEEQTTGDNQNLSWFRLFTLRQTWAFFFGKFFTDPIWWFFLFWLPSYFSAKFNMDLKANYGLPIIIIYTVASIGSIGGGYLSSFLIKNGWQIYKARKTSMLIFALCVVPIVTAQFMENIWAAVALISLAAAAHQAWSANIYTTVSDMFPKKTVSSVVGIGGMAGSLGGVLFPLIVGVLLDYYKATGNITAGYNIIFIICGSSYILAWLIMHLLVPKIQPVKL